MTFASLWGGNVQRLFQSGCRAREFSTSSMPTAGPAPRLRRYTRHFFGAVGPCRTSPGSSMRKAVARRSGLLNNAKLQHWISPARITSLRKRLRTIAAFHYLSSGQRSKRHPCAQESSGAKTFIVGPTCRPSLKGQLGHKVSSEAFAAQVIVISTPVGNSTARHSRENRQKSWLLSVLSVPTMGDSRLSLGVFGPVRARGHRECRNPGSGQGMGRLGGSHAGGRLPRRGSRLVRF